MVSNSTEHAGPARHAWFLIVPFVFAAVVSAEFSAISCLVTCWNSYAANGVFGALAGEAVRLSL